ncbi:MAG: hypothetical protein KBS81_00895, partial [Spirochaetales bacterium]|nr:hypothetical protein [Candidatus Physcosoma equi]
MKHVLANGLTWMLILSLLVSCVPGGFTGPGRPTEKMLMTESARMIDSSYDSVRRILVENGEYSEEEFASYGTVDGETVTRALKETEGGDAY